MSAVNKLLSFLPLGRLESAAAVSRRLCETFSMRLLPRRNVALYGYKTKKKRIIRESRDPENLEWAKALLEKMKQDEASKNSDQEPHMLHLVYLIKPTKGRPWWEKDMLKKLGIENETPSRRPIIAKNIPSINKMLLEVKHMVRILPLKFPHGLPEHESDMEHTLIKSNGEMVVVKRLKEYEPEETAADQKKDLWTLELDTIKKDLDKKLRDYDVHTEYHKAKYVYRFNQDGKEYRYTNNKDVPKYDW